MKFRYCFFCKKPVTKQNFRSRHLHANLDLPTSNNNNISNSNKKQKKDNVVKLGNNNKDERTGIREKNNQSDITEKDTSGIPSKEECTKPVTDDDDKSNTKNEEEEVLCSSSTGDDDLERLSLKIRKLVSSAPI